MLQVRAALVAAFACLALSAVAVPAADAAKPRALPALYTVNHVTGVAKHGKTFTGRYGIQRFVTMGGNVYSYGTLTGRLGHRKVTRSGVMMPVQLTGPSGARASQATCTVLHLVLGPVNLNLLGLKVTLGGGAQANQPIVLDLTAQQGGGILGDLLCGVTNLLNQNGILSQLNGQLQNLTATLNSVIALLGGLQGA